MQTEMEEMLPPKLTKNQKTFFHKDKITRALRGKAEKTFYQID